MTYVVGVDGCKVGWVAVSLRTALTNGDALSANLYPSLAALWESHRAAARIWLDIPIGLAESTARLVDGEARNFLKPLRHNSVFSAPVRAIIESSNAMTYAEACALSREKRGKAISQQSWAIVSKIREADMLLRADSNAREVIVESHPEVVFAALNGGQPMSYPKKETPGRAERLSVLGRFAGNLQTLVDRFFGVHLKRDCGFDDLIDALALAIGASHKAYRYLPQSPEIDMRGLPMRIAYPIVPSGAGSATG